MPLLSGRIITTAVLLTLATSMALSRAPDIVARTPAKVDSAGSLLGSYLAGRFARGANDTASAATYYRSALARDPNNDVLLEQAFLMELSEGNGAEAEALARRLVAAQDTHRIARQFLGLAAFKRQSYAEADEHFRAAAAGPIGELTGALSRAWLRVAQGDVGGALELLQGAGQAEWAQYYARYHRALILDAAGRQAEARTHYERVFKADSRTLRIALAFARHAAHAGDMKLARAILKEHIDRGGSEGHPMARQLRSELLDGAHVSLLISNPTDGLAEVLYGLGEALSTEGGLGVGAIYLQMALYLRPDLPVALVALANVYEATKRYEQAIAIYDTMPRGTPLDSSIEIKKAINLNLLERVDEAKALLERLASEDPSDIRPLDVLGGIMRARKRYDEAIEYYSRAIALIPKAEKKHWTYWYSRGTCYERLKKWPKAEADLLKALQLQPDQPLVLNYLGYSWIDQNKNLKRGMHLIEKAVALKPDDGYIVDSLGWAHYRLGNFKEAVRHLERAVELRPEDPILNDHLGDALWRVGREREARFQWEQALTLKPEPEDADKIRAKLQTGLPPVKIARTAKKGKEASRNDGVRKRVDTQVAPSFPIQ